MKPHKASKMAIEEAWHKVIERAEIARVSEQLRQLTPRGERETCFICDKYRPITHLHHAIPVAELAAMIVKRKIRRVELYMPTVWLCPNHHAVWHEIQKDIPSTEIWGCLTREELERYDQLKRMVSTDEIIKMLERAEIEQG